MARNYDIDEDAFYADPEHYQFSEKEIRSLNARALEDYEHRVPMTPAEKRALRKWVASGHSVGESPGSKYICDLGMDFLDVYRADHEIAAAIRGKTKAEKIAYIKEYTGYVDPTPEELERMDAIRNTPVYVQKKYETLSRKLFLLWEFLATEGLCQEAREYLEDHKDEEMPMDFSFILEQSWRPCIQLFEEAGVRGWPRIIRNIPKEQPGVLPAYHGHANADMDCQCTSAPRGRHRPRTQEGKSVKRIVEYRSPVRARICRASLLTDEEPGGRVSSSRSPL